MPNATKYVDSVNGNNGNTGDSEAQAYADIPTALAAITGGGNIIYVQAGASYTITSTLTVSVAGDATNGPNVIEGYTTTPGARDGRPTITANNNTFALITASNCDYFQLRHLNLTYTGASRGIGVTAASTVVNNLVIDDCIIDGCSTGVSDGFGLPYFQMLGGEVKNCTQDGFFADDGSSIYAFDGVKFLSNGRDGIRIGYAVSVHLDVERCEFRGNGGRGIYQSTTTPMLRLELVHNTFRGNGLAGVEDAATTVVSMLVHRDNLYTTNGGYGISQACTASASKASVAANQNNAYGSGGQANTSGARNVLAAGTGDIATVSADPYTSPTDSTPNDTAGGGALLRSAGTNGADIGAEQHQASGGARLYQSARAMNGGIT